MFGATFVVRGCGHLISWSKGYKAPESCGVVACERAGDVGVAAPQLGICVCCDCGLGSCGRRGLILSVFFQPCFPHKQGHYVRFSIRYKLDQLSCS